MAVYYRTTGRYLTAGDITERLRLVEFLQDYKEGIVISKVPLPWLTTHKVQEEIPADGTWVRPSRTKFPLQYHIWVIDLGYSRKVFGDLAKGFQECLLNQGIACSYSLNYRPGVPNIVFGTHLLTNIIEMDPQTIIINMEQLHKESWWLTPTYIYYLTHYQVWDYHPSNLEFLAKEYQVTNIKLFTLAFNSWFIFPLKEERTIDILFLGSKSERRQKALDAVRLGCPGKRYLFAMAWEEERIRALQEARIILNIHLDDHYTILEVHRIIPSMGGKNLVITEPSSDPVLDKQYEERGVVFTPLDKMPEVVAYYLDHPELIKEKVETAYQWAITHYQSLPI